MHIDALSRDDLLLSLILLLPASPSSTPSILQWGEDRRLDVFRGGILHLAVFWLLQGTWVWTVCLPATLSNAASPASDPPLGPAELLLLLLWLLAWVLEAVADPQKQSHRRRQAEGRGRGPNRDSEAPWCAEGVWRWSRHPNYFAEVSHLTERLHQIETIQRMLSLRVGRGALLPRFLLACGASAVSLSLR